MPTDFATIIADYRERCARLLKDAKPDSAEDYAYSTMLPVFESQDILRVVTSLDAHARNMAALNLAPSETHIKAREARAIVREWAKDFIHDTGI